MAHNNIAYTGANDGTISAIQIPGTNGTTKTYEIHDASAIHSLEELNVATIMHFKGTVADKAALDKVTGMSVGDVYHVTDTGIEYVYADNKWEPLGNVFAADVASDEHTHDVSVTGSNQSSEVTGTVEVSVPKVTFGSIAIPKVTNNTAVDVSYISENKGVTASKIDATSILASASVSGGILSFGSAAVADVAASKITASNDKASKVTLAANDISVNSITAVTNETKAATIDLTAKAQTWTASTVTVTQPVEEE